MPLLSWGVMRRREFLGVLGGAATLPLVARAQQPERVRRIGVLMHAVRTIRRRKPASQRSCRGCSNWAGSTAATCASIPAGPQAMRTRSQIRSGTGSTRTGRHAGHGNAPALPPLQRATRTMPIVFAAVVDPVGAGFVTSLRQPTATPPASSCSSSASAENGWNCSREIAPHVRRVVVIRVRVGPPASASWRSIQSLAPSLGVDFTPVDISDAAEIDRGVITFAGVCHGGLVVTGGRGAVRHRE